MWSPLERIVDSLFRSQNNELSGLGLVRCEAEPEYQGYIFWFSLQDNCQKACVDLCCHVHSSDMTT
jgi:hypothetical protein